MSSYRIILAMAVFLVESQISSAQQFAPTAPPVVVIPCQPMAAPPDPCDMPCPPYLQPSPMVIDNGPMVMPVMPPPTIVYPSPNGATPPPAFAPPGATVAGPLEGIAPGGTVSPQFGLPAGPEAAAGLANPISVPAANDEWAWDQITDVVNEYFTIANQQRARRSGAAWSEGRIETAPQGGATVLEPQRHDSVGLFNRWESTFQTIRRRAVVRVIPDAVGYSVEVVVDKELEDLPHPEHATAGAATFRDKGSLPSRHADQVSRTRSSPRWISLGRDLPLEQRMLADIHARLAGVTTGSPSSLVP
jgi:hypothetical protein